MRSVGVLMLLLGAAVAVGMSIDTPRPEPPPAVESDWVRTVDGWEKSSSLGPKAERREPALHPFAVAGFQSLASVLALVALETNRRSNADVR